MSDSVHPFYDYDYFSKRLAKFGELQARANLFKFKEFVRQDDNLLDFGCGSGHLLAALPARNRIGIDINPWAVAHAKSLGISEAFSNLDSVSDGWADCIVSNHALEHVRDPTEVMRQFHRVLKPTGLLIIVTPYDNARRPYREDDPDRHLFAWSPSNLGNFADEIGFHVIEVKELPHRWPPKWDLMLRLLGDKAFHLVCTLYGHMKRDRTQVRLVARKP